MAKENFTVRLTSFEEVHELPESWNTQALRSVLVATEFDDDVQDADLNDMVAMALQDLGSREAAELVLEVVFAAIMSAGVRQNLSTELEEERPWEQFADVAKQAGVFQACVLLHRAFPNLYGTPDAVKMEVSITASDPESSDWLRSLAPSLLVRLCAAGMPADAVLHRLYGQELASHECEAAQHILWRADLLEPINAGEPAEARLAVYGSHQWLDPLQNIESWRARAWPDDAD